MQAWRNLSSKSLRTNAEVPVECFHQTFLMRISNYVNDESTEKKVLLSGFVTPPKDAVESGPSESMNFIFYLLLHVSEIVIVYFYFYHITPTTAILCFILNKFLPVF